MRRNLLAWIIISGLISPAWADGIITVDDVNAYFPTRNFQYSGPGPYLSYVNAESKLSAEIHASAKKFKADVAVIDVTADAKEPVKQINLSATICNPWQEGGGWDLKPELVPVKEAKKALLQEEVMAAAKELFDTKLAKSEIAAIKDGEKIDSPAFRLAYREYPAKCDTNGGQSVYYKIFLSSY